MSQLCIHYTLQLGTVSLPKTANPEHMPSNAQIDIVISEADMQALWDLDERISPPSCRCLVPCSGYDRGHFLRALRLSR